MGGGIGEWGLRRDRAEGSAFKRERMVIWKRR